MKSTAQLLTLYLAAERNCSMLLGKEPEAKDGHKQQLLDIRIGAGDDVSNDHTRLTDRNVRYVSH